MEKASLAIRLGNRHKKGRGRQDLVWCRVSAGGTQTSNTERGQPGCHTQKGAEQAGNWKKRCSPDVPHLQHTLTTAAGNPCVRVKALVRGKRRTEQPAGPVSASQVERVSGGFHHSLGGRRGEGTSFFTRLIKAPYSVFAFCL